MQWRRLDMLMQRSCKTTGRTEGRTPSWNRAGERMGEQGICRWAGEGNGQPAVGDGARRDKKLGGGLLRAHEKDDGWPGPGRCGEGWAGEWPRKMGESGGGPEEGTGRAERGQAHVVRVAKTVLQVAEGVYTRIVVRLPQGDWARERRPAGASTPTCGKGMDVGRSTFRRGGMHSTGSGGAGRLKKTTVLSM